MTGFAGLAKMGAFQYVSCFRMIKGHFAPPVAVMTIHTFRFRIIFGIEDRLMDILMAIVTLDPYIPEAPLIILFMTCETGRCQVRARQFKGSFIMHFNGKPGLLKSMDGMTFRTIGCPLLSRELLFVIINVAIRTPAVFKVGCISCFMTAGA
jgi:hypothetical protein